MMAFEGDGRWAVEMLGIMVPIVGSIALFSFLGVASWSEARRKEREAYYTSEALKKIAESSGEGAKSALEYLQERHRNSARRRIEGLKLGGLITAAVGLGLMIFLHSVAHEAEDHGAYLVGLIPLLIGVALMVYAFVLAPKEQQAS
jgi:hypothetical protein